MPSVGATGFDCRIAGEIKGFDPFQWIEKKELKKMGRFIQVALAGADFAVRMSNWKPEQSDLDEVGVYISSGIGGFDIIEREHGKLLHGGRGRISPFFIPSAIVNLASGHVSIRYGARGPNSATATACSASAHAIGDSFKIIERGAAEMMICGGTEATITPMGVGGFAAMKALSTRNDDPARASRPWDAGRDGFVVGEGAGIVILESLVVWKRASACSPCVTRFCRRPSIWRIPIRSATWTMSQIRRAKRRSNTRFRIRLALAAPTPR